VLAVTVPLNVGSANGAFAARSETRPEIFDCAIAAEAEISSLMIVPLTIFDDATELAGSVIDAPVAKVTEPVNTGEASGAFLFSAPATESSYTVEVSVDPL